MSKFYYDLHLHSCLSPCGDNEMTPNNIAGMGVVAQLDVMALTDHNTCRNCPAFFEAAQRQGIIPVAGMELTTAEDIHVVCLFPTLETALAFNDAVDARRIRIPNRKDIFGEQLIMDGADAVIGEDPFLLSNATEISVEEAPALAEQFDGVCYPAHIDREANGIVAVLGVFPDTPPFPCAELHDAAQAADYVARFPVLAGKPLVVSSDAHYLWDISGREHSIELDAAPGDAQAVRTALIERLRGR